MFINGIGTALPPHRYTQKECWEAFVSSGSIDRLSLRSRALLRKVLLSGNGIGSRYLALPDLTEAFQINPDVLHRRFLEHAPRLAAQSARRALENAGIDALELDAVIISTCTGYLCPGLTSYVIEELRLPQQIQTIDMVGQGCGAALPNLRTASALLQKGSAQHVLSICVEVCSAAFYLDDDPGVLISACLFGDGAGAMVLSHDPAPDKRQIRWRHAESVTVPKHRDLLRFEQRQGMLRNILSPSVPALASKYAEQILMAACKRTGHSPRNINHWILHAGGRDVLLALQRQLQLNPHDLQWSAAILRECGNLSSSSVIHVLENALNNQAQGGSWWMSSFGAGFSCHGALLDVEPIST